ncbi:MAG: hypothetical protein Ta2D_03550 [Rickettsiales bacterium]|nr:MAG: hypothetical protein Ta2D_03550 [Rickettsiales bacterium]
MFGFFAKLKEVCEIVIGYKLRFDAIEGDLKELKGEMKELKTQGESLKTEVLLIKNNHIHHLDLDNKEIKANLKDQKSDIDYLKGKLDMLIEILNRQGKIL